MNKISHKLVLFLLNKTSELICLMIGKLLHSTDMDLAENSNLFPNYVTVICHVICPGHAEKVLIL